jgi:hypothetical protein
MNAGGFGFEQDLSSGAEARRDQIFDHFLLRIDGDGLAAGQIRQIDAVAGAAEAELDTSVHKTFSSQAIADAGLSEQVDGPLFENTGADALFGVFAAATFEDDGFNSLQVEQVRKRQSGGACTNDAYLCSHR